MQGVNQKLADKLARGRSERAYLCQLRLFWLGSCCLNVLRGRAPHEHELDDSRAMRRSAFAASKAHTRLLSGCKRLHLPATQFCNFKANLSEGLFILFFSCRVLPVESGEWRGPGAASQSSCKTFLRLHWLPGHLIGVDLTQFAFLA